MFRLIFAGLLGGLLGAGDAPPALTCDGGRQDRFDGWWRSDLGTELLEISADEATLSIVTPVGCIVQWSAARTEPQHDATGLSLSFDHGDVRLVASELDADALQFEASRVPWSDPFRRLDRTPPAARKTAPSDPLTCFDVMAWIVGAECPCLVTRKIDWDAVTSRERARLTPDSSDRDLYRAMTAAIDAIDDAHCSLLAPGIGWWAEAGALGKELPTDENLPKLQASIVDKHSLLRPPTRCSDPTICYGKISNLLGYVRVESFILPSIDSAADDASARKLGEDLDAMVREFDFVESVVVDLRFNLGGNPDSMLALASRFMPNGPAEVGVVRRTRVDDRAGRTAPERVRVDAGERPRFRKKLFVLTSRWSMSAGEMFALALSEREPPIVRVGECTQGTFCNRTTRTLPNGWKVDFPTRSIVSARGEDFELRGLPMDVAINMPLNMANRTGRDAMLEKILELLGDR